MDIDMYTTDISNSCPVTNDVVMNVDESDNNNSNSEPNIDKSCQ